MPVWTEGRPASSWSRAQRGWASPAWAGSSRSTWTASPTPCCGTGAAACPTAKASPFGRWPRSSASASASPKRTRPRSPPKKLEEGVCPLRPRRGRARLRGGPALPALGSALRLGGQGRAVPRGALCRLAPLLRAPGPGGAGRRARRRRPARRREPARVLRAPDRLDPGPPHLRGALRPTGPARHRLRATGWAATVPRSPSTPSTTPPWRRWSSHLSPACPPGPGTRSPPGPRASPCSPSRRCARSSTKGSSNATKTVTAWSGTWGS